MSKPFILFLTGFLGFIVLAVLVPGMRLSSGTLNIVLVVVFICISLIIIGFFAGIFKKKKPGSKGDNQKNIR